MASIDPPSPLAQQLLAVIAQQIASGRIQAGKPETFLAYSEALELLGQSTPWAGSGARLTKLGLEDLHVWTEDYEELPKVTGLIVDKYQRRPHQGFAKWHGHENDPDWETWWLNEAKKAIEYDWSPYLPDAAKSKVREDEVDYDTGVTIVADPPPARIRHSGITVADVLCWLAAGESEREVLLQHPDLNREDIRASLRFAAAREAQAAQPSTSRFSQRWTGKFTLPPPNPEDPRLTSLLERYERGAQ